MLRQFAGRAAFPRPPRSPETKRVEPLGTAAGRDARSAGRSHKITASPLPIDRTALANSRGVQLEARHQIAELCSVRAHAVADCACKGFVGVGIAVRTPGWNMRQVEVLDVLGACAEQVCADDGRNCEASFRTPKPASTMAAPARGIGTPDSRTGLALPPKRCLRRQNPFAIHPFAGSRRDGLRPSVRTEDTKNDRYDQLAGTRRT